MSWQGLEDTCLKPFGASSTRSALTSQLAAFLGELRGMGLLGQLWVDGSFVTDKPDPGDVDVVYIPDLACLPELNANSARISVLFAQHGAKSIYNCHAYLVDPANMHQLAYWRGLFGFCRDDVTPKGMILLTL